MIYLNETELRQWVSTVRGVRLPRRELHQRYLEYCAALDRRPIANRELYAILREDYGATERLSGRAWMMLIPARRGSGPAGRSEGRPGRTDGRTGHPGGPHARNHARGPLRAQETDPPDQRG